MRRHTRAGIAAGAYALGGGLVAFCGWAFDVPRLTDWFNDGISMQPNTAVLMVLGGAAAMAVHLGYRPIVTVLGALVGTVGCLMLLQHLLGADFGFNHQLLFGRTWGGDSTVTPGRTGPPASVSFVMTGTALIVLSWRAESGLRRLVPLMAVLVAVIMLFSLSGYLFGARRFYAIPWLSAIALQTATMFVALSSSLILAVPERQPMRLLLSNSGAGDLGRRVLPLVILVPPLLGWLRSQGEALGLYDTGTGRALLIVSFVTFTVAVVWLALTALERREEREQESREAARAAERQVADALREADRRKDEFLALLAHELRNPLAPIRHAVQVLQLGPSSDDASRRARAVIDRQVQQMARLVDDLLDVSRISRGKVELRRERVELDAVLTGAIEASRPLIDQGGHRLVVEPFPEPIWLDADLTRLVQVFCNLLNNAAKFSPRGSEIRLAVGRDGTSAIVTVKDGGVGMSPETLPTVFDLFMQGDVADGSMRSGLGIGLTLVKRLVTQHGGSVEAVSDGPGMGSEFVVRLPLDPVTASQARVSEPVSGRREALASGRRVLIVDDNRDAAEAVGMMVSRLGVDIRTAHDGLEAVRLASEYRPDVVLLDIGLPKLNGYDVAKAIRREPWGAAIRIVAMTGWGQESDRARSMEAGFDLHLVKPVSPDTVTELVTSESDQSERAPARR